MFTGLVADLGTVEQVQTMSDGARLRVESALAASLSEGDSIAVCGVCLTATAVSDGAFSADVMAQTLRLSSLGRLRAGSRVNLELALRADDRLGGHVVQGHVDGTARVTEVVQDGFARRVSLACAHVLLRYLVDRGSVAIDGVSLTVAEAGEDSFTVSLIPETLQRTTLGAIEEGDEVNVEVDVLAKHVERLLAASRT